MTFTAQQQVRYQGSDWRLEQTFTSRNGRYARLWNSAGRYAINVPDSDWNDITAR